MLIDQFMEFGEMGDHIRIGCPGPGAVKVEATTSTD